LALLAASLGWQTSVDVSASGGYKDNLLLSHSNEERSAFMRGSIDGLAWRVPHGRVDYSAFLKAEGTRYFSGKLLRHDSQVFTQLEGRYRVEDRFSAVLDVQGYYLDQVFDVSDTEITRLVTELKAIGLKVGPTLHWEFMPKVWVEAAAVGTRETFPDGAFNATMLEPKLLLGWRPIAPVALSIIGTEHRTNYDRRPRYTDTGRVDTSAVLTTREPELEGRIDITWGAKQAWKTITRVGRARYMDNGSGYLNYRQKHVAQELEWSSDRWFFHAEADAGRRNYELQTVDRGISPPPQIKDQYTAQLRAERKLSDRWTLFAEYNWERSRSNDTIASYVVNEGLLGARWTWEK
jgi:hypothetical protein